MTPPKTAAVAVHAQPTFGYVLKDTAKLYVQRFEERAGELGLTLPQCKALVYLSRSEGMSQVELAGSCEIDPMSMVRILDRMESDGWVERRADPTDRRATLVSLTPSGEAAAHSVYALGDRMISEVLEGWSGPDVRKYTALTERFVADALAAADRMLERGLLPAHD